MNVILLEDDVRLGDRGSMVQVKPGFARNYLLPQKKALLATEGNISMMRNMIQLQNKRIERERKAHQEIAQQLKDLSIEFEFKSGITGHLYGTVTTEQIVEQIKAKTHLEISKKKVALSTHIKTAGTYQAKIKLFAGVDVTIPVIVTLIKEEDSQNTKGRIKTARTKKDF
ncbi:MAG: 50S ribosomal protein L9 [Candidatus Margulisiibacteriota bacterium]